MTNFATIKKYDPFMEQIDYCVADMKLFLRIDTRPNLVYTCDKTVFKQYLNRYYTPRVIEAADAYVRKVWDKHI